MSHKGDRQCFFFFPLRKLIPFRGREVEEELLEEIPFCNSSGSSRAEETSAKVQSEQGSEGEGLLGDRASRGFEMARESNLDTLLKLVDSGEGSTKSQSHNINIYANLTLWEQEGPTEFTL